jgi:hypothetical protein
MSNAANPPEIDRARPIRMAPSVQSNAIAGAARLAERHPAANATRGIPAPGIPLSMKYLIAIISPLPLIA